MSPFRGSAPFTAEWKHFRYEVDAAVATVTFTRPDKLNALTFEAYADLRDLLHELPQRDQARALVLRGEGRAFCSGGDVSDIIGELFARDMRGLLEFTRVTGALIGNIRRVRKPDGKGDEGEKVRLIPRVVVFRGMMEQIIRTKDDKDAADHRNTVGGWRKAGLPWKQS